RTATGFQLGNLLFFAGVPVIANAKWPKRGFTDRVAAQHRSAVHAEVTGFIHVKRFLNVGLGFFVLQLNFFQAKVQWIKLQELDAVGIVHIEGFGEVARNIAIVGASNTIVDFVENQEICRLEDVELLFDDFQLVRRQRLGFGIPLFSEDLVKLFGLRERDTNGIEVNPAFNVPANGAKEGPKLLRRGAFWLRTAEIGLVAENRIGKKILEFFSESMRRRIVLFQIDEFVKGEQVGLGEAHIIGLSSN